MTIDEYNLGLNVIQIVLGLVAGIGGFCLISPAKRKLLKLESALENQNNKIDLIQRSVVDSNVRNIEAKFNRSCDACFAIYEAFHKLYIVSSPVLNMCKYMKDLKAIKERGGNSDELCRLAKMLKNLIPPDWENDKVFASVVSAELIVPANIYNLYSEAQTLFWLLKAQILNLEAGTSGFDFDFERICKNINAFFPGMGDNFKAYGTTYYATIMDAIKTRLQNEIRQHLDLPPITVDDVSKFVAEPSGLLRSSNTIPPEFRSAVQRRECNHRKAT